jgi:hypothetical protein
MVEPDQGLPDSAFDRTWPSQAAAELSLSSVERALSRADADAAARALSGEQTGLVVGTVQGGARRTATWGCA